MSGINVASVEIELTCNCFELFLDLLPVHHMPPIGNIFRSLVVVLEIIGMFPYIEALKLADDRLIAEYPGSPLSQSPSHPSE